MDACATILKAIADPTRIRILACLDGHELCVCELFDVLGLTQSSLSTHLKVLRHANVVTATRRGKWIYYRLAADHALLIQAFFRHFEDEFKKSRQLKGDHQKLRRRLALRKSGCCVVGFENCCPK